jgi:antirestriction protein ArdC
MSNKVLSQQLSPYDAITGQIIAAIEAGAGTCVMPWHGGMVPMTLPKNAATEMPYHGTNVVALWAQAASKHFLSGYWASYQQWRQLGAQVRKGERGSLIIFYKKLEPAEAGDEGKSENTQRFVLKTSHVFNAAQVEGWEHPVSKRPSQVETNAQVEAFVRASKADVRLGFSRAYYARHGDYIAMPGPAQFIGTPTSSPTESYYAVLLHELTHWTGAEHRIDRVFGKRFGDYEYACEELVAELGAAFLCSAFGIVNQPRPDHAAYIAHWLEILGKDNRAIFKAASMAQEAVEYLRIVASA